MKKLPYPLAPPELLLYEEAKRLEHFLWLKENAKPLIFSEDILAAEIGDLLSNNIPYFSSTADGKTAYSAEKRSLSLAIRLSGLTRVKQHLTHHFNEKDLRLQLAIIENSFTALQLDQSGFLPREKKWSLKTPTLPAENIKNEALALAKKALDQLVDYAIIGEERIMWPSIDLVGIDAWSAGFTDIDLYRGVAGVALAFAYGASINKNKTYEKIARLGLNSIIDVLSTEKEKAIHSVGGFSGLGGLIYALSIFNRFIPDKRIRPTLATLLTWADSFIEKDHTLDIVGGCAGFIASVIAARALIDSNTLMALLTIATDHLLTQYPEPDKLPDSLENKYSDQPLLGFSHGIAGFTWALAKANEFLHDKKIESWIKNALAYERCRFDAKKITGRMFAPPFVSTPKPIINL
ncbi:lanthionine synthetase LanC family protein [Coxiella burnetii]|uniref:lanthionine synthetase LanC family protein n=2 Tax=Coxiella burnetii TaxID=777 RepID=UPI0003018E32|nr:lanthionine synthetase LanC family protein [Coxiella burnetii]ARK27526.1 hypothetical protein BMW92_06365 [Coxiella burnetii]